MECKSMLVIEGMENCIIKDNVNEYSGVRLYEIPIK